MLNDHRFLKHPYSRQLLCFVVVHNSRLWCLIFYLSSLSPLELLLGSDTTSVDNKDEIWLKSKLLLTNVLRHHFLLNFVELSFSTDSCSSRLLRRNFGMSFHETVYAVYPCHLFSCIKSVCHVVVLNEMAGEDPKIFHCKTTEYVQQDLALVLIKCHFVPT
jgi:hypothetical protein